MKVIEINDCKKMFPQLEVMEISALDSSNVDDAFLRLLQSILFKLQKSLKKINYHFLKNTFIF